MAVWFAGGIVPSNQSPARPYSPGLAYTLTRHLAARSHFCESMCAARPIPPVGLRNPSERRPVKVSLAGWLSRMSKALPKGGSALCYVQGYEHPA